MDKILKSIKEKKGYIIATIIFFVLSIFLSDPFKNETSNKIIYMFLWFFIFLLSIAFVIFVLNKKADEKTFLKMAGTLGITIIVLMPIFNPYDEPAHFFRGVMISQGNFYDQVDENGNIGGYVPENYSEFFSKAINIKEIVNNPGILKETFSKEKTFFPMIYCSSAVPTAHCVPALGILVAKILNLGIIFSVFLGRLFDYIFYVAFAYLAIKNMKYYKSIMFIVATIPISLWVAGGISIDPILSASSFLFVSICLKYYWDEGNVKISKKDIFLLFFTGAMILTNKYLAYSPILLTFFIIPRKSFVNMKRYILTISLACIMSILCGLWQLDLLNKFEYKEDRNGNVDQKQQIQYIKSNIDDSSRTMLNAMQNMGTIHSINFTYKNNISFIKETTGLVIILGAILEKNKFIKNRKKKNKLSVYLFVLFLITLALSLLALYLSFTPVGESTIKGYQTRYLVSMLILLLIPLANVVNVKNNIKNYEQKIVYFMFLANLDLILGVLVDVFKV